MTLTGTVELRDAVLAVLTNGALDVFEKVGTMADVADLKAYYDAFDVKRSREYWARPWGGTHMQWYGAILPRIAAHLPCSTILEIGCANGRLSNYLRGHARHLHLVDVSEHWLAACRRRFQGDTGVQLHVNDGHSLRSIDDGTVDFAFSFFSLVHADTATMRSYVHELGKKLTANGVAFLHHSNAADCEFENGGGKGRYGRYNDQSVGADLVSDLVHDAGLVCRGQETFSWDGSDDLTDCFTTFARHFAGRDTRQVKIETGTLVRKRIDSSC